MHFVIHIITLSKQPEELLKGLDSAKSHTIGIACRPKVFVTPSLPVSHPQSEEPLSDILSIENAKYTPTASPYALAPLPPSDSAMWSLNTPTATASASAFCWASETREEKVVRAVSWRGVKRSLVSLKPYSETLTLAFPDKIPLGASSGRETCAALRCSLLAVRYRRPYFPSATTAVKTDCIRCSRASWRI